MGSTMKSQTLKTNRSYPIILMFMMIVLICGMMMKPIEVHATTKPLTLQVQVVPVDYLIAGKRLITASTDQAFMVNQRLHVPLRILGQALQKQVTWENKTTTVRFNDTAISTGAKFDDKSNWLNATKKLTKSRLNITYPAVKFFINNSAMVLTANAGKPFMYKNRLYVPLRFIAEAFSQQVIWDGKSMIVKMNATKTSTNTGDSGNSGGTVTDPKEEKKKTIIANTDNKLRTLQTRCQRDLTEIFNQYRSATTDEQKKQWIDKGVKAVNTCDYTFNLIMTTLNNQLVNIGVFPNDIVASYRKEYDERKQKNYDSITQGG